MFFTGHALLRMDERDIAEEEVYEVFNRKYVSLTGKVQKIIGKTDEGRFLVLFVADHTRLVSLREADDKEVKLYKRRVK